MKQPMPSLGMAAIWRPFLGTSNTARIIDCGQPYRAICSAAKYTAVPVSSRGSAETVGSTQKRARRENAAHR